MAISIDFADEGDVQARIKVVGVGGGGGNALNTMIASGLEGVEFIAANTDAQALENSLAPCRIQLGKQLTKGLGAGGSPDCGRKGALEDVQRISEAMQGADMVFITAGMGGGTGTGAAPVISQIAKDQGALTVGVVTRPFDFEGRRRTHHAEQGLADLVDAVDTIITIPNQKLIELAVDDMSLLEAFQRADDVLLQAVRGISDLILNAGMINVDFADVRTIMSNTGRALMGTGYGKGEHRALEAARHAVESPLLDDVSVEGATGILINFTAGPDIKLREINEAATFVQESAHPDANIIFGVVTDPDMTDTVKVTVIATGFEPVAQRGTRSRLQQGRGAHRGAVGAASMEAEEHLPMGEHGRDRFSAGPRRMSDVAAGRGGTAQPPPLPPQRAFGASAIHDEAVLDIPAYLRRGQGHNPSR